MEKMSTRQVSTALFLYSFKIAKLVAENEDVFPKSATMEDYEKLMLYALALFAIHDETHNKLLNDEMFYDATMDLYTSILEKEVLPAEEVYALAKNSNAVINDFLKEHWLFIHNNEDANDLIKYTSTILSKIPSCKDYNGYTLVGATFASLLPQILDTIAENYNTIISSWDKSLDEDMDDGWTSFFDEKENESVEKESVEDAQKAAAESPKPTAQPTPEVQAEKKNKPSRSFIICLIVLCVSLCANAYLAYQCSTLKTEVSDKEFSLTQADYRERRHLEEINRYQKNLGAISHEYSFYHDHAVIVTESGSRYHSYGCYHIRNASFWIYNVEAAKSEGYTPCKDCNPPQ